MTRRIDRTQPCTAADARARLSHAQLYREVAKLAIENKRPDECTIATGNAVLAAIAAADAICCAGAKRRFRGENHRQAAELLAEVTGDRALAAALREAIDLKDEGHYGLGNVDLSWARKAIRRAERLDVAAEDLVPGARKTLWGGDLVLRRREFEPFIRRVADGSTGRHQERCPSNGKGAAGSLAVGIQAPVLPDPSAPSPHPLLSSVRPPAP